MIEILFGNTVNKTVIAFNYFIHNWLDTRSLANGEERQLYSHAGKDYT